MNVLVWIAIVFGILDVVIFLLYLLERSKNKRLEDNNSSIIAVNNENKEKVKKIIEGSKKTRTYQDRIDKIKPGLKSKTKWIILLMLFITSCSTGKVIYKTEYLKPEIPKLKIFDRPQIIDTGSLKALVEAYEDEVTIYNEFREEYYLEE